uniref:Cyclin-dependent kinase inhibitor 1B n=1 Tax=Anolis carolinensis TaxID=28377 RepID=H9G8U5_ANOCA|nr:PREDICTED: cyclin-dependent kinase inhibitor 1B [Anolis carolinensis]|eukprot:XP_008119870.1 PREDICTED: cyclin-dependent kinase inhibitor 1B [Anolis carolinensis]
MSTARVSSGSPTLERMEARQAEGAPKPSACRSLFGPVDHAELARELRRHRREAEEAARRRWEFDFLREQPLRGPGARFEWRALRKDALPDFYSRPPRLSRRWGSGAGPGDSPPAAGKWRPQWRRIRGLSAEEEDGDEEEATQADGEGPPSSRKRPVSDDSCLPNKRANMTEEAVSEGSPSASSVEQTPKKSSPRHRQT